MDTEQKRRKTPLQDALEERGVKQLELAAELCLGEPTVSKILRGTYRMHDVRSRGTVVRVLRHASEKIGVSLEELARARGIDADQLASSLTRLERLDKQAAERAAAGAAA